MKLDKFIEEYGHGTVSYLLETRQVENNAERTLVNDMAEELRQALREYRDMRISGKLTVETL